MVMARVTTDSPFIDFHAKCSGMSDLNRHNEMTTLDSKTQKQT